MACRVITFANKKGGSGKTSTAVNLAAVLSKKNKRVLIIDLDNQCHATLISGINAYDKIKGAYSFFKTKKFSEIIKKTPFNLYDIIPSVHSESEVVLYNKELEYKDILVPLRNYYDYIIIDTPPSRRDILTFCFCVSDELIVPMPLQFLAMEGLAQLLGQMYYIARKYNQKIRLSGIIPVMVDMRSKHSQLVLKELKNTFGDSIIKRGIRIDVKISEASWEQKPVIIYSPYSKASYDFNILAEDILMDEN